MDGGWVSGYGSLSMDARVLVVDDEKNILATLSRALRVEGYEVEVAGNAAIALDKLAGKAYDVLLLDVLLPDMDGIQVLKKLRADEHDVPVLVMSGHGTIDTAVEATRLGAHDFLEKPIGTERLLLSIARCLEYEALESENRELRQQTGTVDALLGDSQPMRELRERIGLAASASAPVLVASERGTGKELVARAIHAESPRASGPLEKLNCAAVPSELIESELFGHVRGAFTGATHTRPGVLQQASGGTLLLDEVGDMPAAMQVKLLRVLQDGRVRRVGESTDEHVDARLIAASNRPLAELVSRGHFREDLYYRLNVVELRLPPLRERADDLPLLCEHLLHRIAEQDGVPRKRMARGALKRLAAHPLPGNVRQLEHVLLNACVMGTGDTIEADDLALDGGAPVGAEASAPEDERAPSAPADEPGAGRVGENATASEPPDEIKQTERERIVAALEAHDWNRMAAAKALGMARRTFYRRLREFDIL